MKYGDPGYYENRSKMYIQAIRHEVTWTVAARECNITPAAFKTSLMSRINKLPASDREQIALLLEDQLNRKGYL